MKKEAANTWSDGLIMDINPLSTPNSALTDCINGTFLTYDGNELVLQNDRGNYRLKGSELPENFMPVGIASYGDILYVISYNPITNKSEIGSYPSPNTTVSADLDNSLNVESILTQAFKYEVNDTEWTKEDLENKYRKDFIFYGVNSDLTINPGDQYIITNVPSSCLYERLTYSIFSDTQTFKINPEINEEGDTTFHPVSWEVAGHLKCSFELPNVTDLNITPLSLDVPKKQMDGDKYKVDGNLQLQYAVSFASNDELIAEAIKNEDAYIQLTVKYGEQYKTINLNKFQTVDYQASTTYSYTSETPIDLELKVDENGNNVNDTIELTAKLCLTMYSPETGKDKDVTIEKASYTLKVDEASLVQEASIADKYFQYEYNDGTLTLYPNLVLATIPSSKLAITTKLYCLNEDWKRKTIKETQSFTRLGDYLVIDFDNIDRDFYAAEFVATDEVDGKVDILAQQTRFVIAAERMNEFHQSYGSDVAYPLFDEIPSDVIYNDAITWQYTNSKVHNLIVRPSAEAKYSATNPVFNYYLTKPSANTLSYLALPEDTPKDALIEGTRPYKVSGIVDFGIEPKNSILEMFDKQESTCMFGADTVGERDMFWHINDWHDVDIRKTTDKLVVNGKTPSKAYTLNFDRVDQDDYGALYSNVTQNTYKTGASICKNCYQVQINNGQSDWVTKFKQDDLLANIRQQWINNHKTSPLMLMNINAHCGIRTKNSHDQMRIGPFAASEFYANPTLDIHGKYQCIVGCNNAFEENEPLLFPINLDSPDGTPTNIDNLVIKMPESEVVNCWYPDKDGVAFEPGHPQMFKFTVHAPVMQNTYKGKQAITGGFFAPTFVSAIVGELLQSTSCSNLQKKNKFTVQFNFELEEGPFPVIDFESVENTIRDNIDYITNNVKQIDIQSPTITCRNKKAPNSDYYNERLTSAFTINDDGCFNIDTGLNDVNAQVFPSGAEPGKEIRTLGKFPNVKSTNDLELLNYIISEPYIEEPDLRAVYCFEYRIKATHFETEDISYTKEQSASIVLHKGPRTIVESYNPQNVFVYVPVEYCNEHPWVEEEYGKPIHTIYVTTLPANLPIKVWYVEDDDWSENVVRTHTHITPVNNGSPNTDSQGANTYFMYTGFEGLSSSKHVYAIKIDWETLEKSSEDGIPSLYWGYYRDNDNYKKVISCN